MKQVSFSQLMTYVRCQEHYLFSYVLGMKRKPRNVFKHGFALHETLQYHFEQKKINGKGISPLEAKEFFVDSFRNALEEYAVELQEAQPFLTREYLAKEKKVSIPDMITTGMKGLDVYSKRLNRYIEPDLVEEAFEFLIEPGLTIRGRIDIADTKGVIHELKTTRISPNKQDIRADAQLAIYQIGYQAITGQAPKGISKDYIVLSKKNSLIVRFKVVRPFIDKKVVLRYVSTIMNGVRNEIFYCVHPAESWICSKEWCAYYKMHQELKKLGYETFMNKYVPFARPRANTLARRRNNA